MVAPSFTEEQFNSVVDRYKRGEKVKDIAREFGVRPETVWRRMRSPYLRRQNLWPRTLFLPDDPATLGYIAGIIDGEGSLLYSGQGHPHIKVQMTDEEVIGFLASFGGKKNTYQPRTENRKPIHCWELARAHDVAHCLHKLLPHMRLNSKKEKAKNFLRQLGFSS